MPAYRLQAVCVDLKFFELLQRFSNESTQTAPRDQDTLGLRFMQRAYALGKEAGAEARTRPNRDKPSGHSDGSDNGG